MSESAVIIAGHSLVGVLCEPDGPARKESAVIFINAGSVHRSGPNRLYVVLARRLAAAGYVSLRFDLPGIGDSPSANGLGKFRGYAAMAVHEAMDYLGNVTGCRRFVVLGLCGGADIAFDAGSADDRVDGLILINGAHVDGDCFAKLYHQAGRKTENRFYLSRAISLERWWRLITFRSKFWDRLRRRKKAVVPNHLACGQPTSEMAGNESRVRWAELANRRTNILMIYSEGSVFWDIYRSANRDFLKSAYPSDRLRVEFLKNVDHTFTLLSAQDHLARQIENWLEANHETQHS